MRQQQLDSLQGLRLKLREIFDNADVTVSDYPVLASLTFGASCMYSYHNSNNSQKFREALDMALNAAEEIVTPKQQDYYAFTNDVWYKANSCHDIVKSMLTTLRAINATIDLESDTAADVQQAHRPNSPPKLTVC